MEQDKYKYTIGGRTYIQRPLVLGQINQLMDAVKDVRIPESLDTLAIIAALGSRLPKALAVVLIEQEPGARSQESGEKKSEAEYLRTRDLDALAGEISFIIDPETTFQVVEDFFDCNPIASLLERFAGMTEKISGKIRTLKATGSNSSASFSAAETSRKETPSSGASPSPK